MIDLAQIVNKAEGLAAEAQRRASDAQAPKIIREAAANASNDHLALAAYYSAGYASTYAREARKCATLARDYMIEADKAAAEMRFLRGRLTLLNADYDHEVKHSHNVAAELLKNRIENLQGQLERRSVAYNTAHDNVITEVELTEYHYRETKRAAEAAAVACDMAEKMRAGLLMRRDEAPIPHPRAQGLELLAAALSVSRLVTFVLNDDLSMEIQTGTSEVDPNHRAVMTQFEDMRPTLYRLVESLSNPTQSAPKKTGEYTVTFEADYLATDDPRMMRAILDNGSALNVIGVQLSEGDTPRYQIRVISRNEAQTRDSHPAIMALVEDCRAKLGAATNERSDRSRRAV